MTGNKENKVWCRRERSQEMLLPGSQGLVTSRDYLFRCRGEARIGSGTIMVFYSPSVTTWCQRAVFQRGASHASVETSESSMMQKTALVHTFFPMAAHPSRDQSDIRSPSFRP